MRSVLEAPQGLAVGPVAVAGWGRWQWRDGRREKVRPARPLQRPTREKVRPASVKRPILGCFERAGRTFSRSHPPPDHAGRTFSRSGRTEVVTVKPTTPLQPLIQASVKPPSPMLAPEQHPLKPTTPMQPKNAPKTPISHPQRRWRFQSRLSRRPQRRCRFQLRLGRRPQRRCRFQLRLGLCPQRRQRFQTTTPPGLQGLTAVPAGSVGSNRHTFACNSFANASCFEVQSLKFRAFHSETERRREGIACDIEYLSIGARYVVEMGGIEPPSLCGAEHHKCSSCGGRRRVQRARASCKTWGLAAVPVGGGRAWPNNKPTHRATSATWHHWCGGRRRDRRAWLRRPWAVAGPGCGARGRRRGLAGLRDDAPSEARGADGSRAGRRPRAHKAARPQPRISRNSANAPRRAVAAVRDGDAGSGQAVA